MTRGCKGPAFVPGEPCYPGWTMTLGRACPLSLPGALGFLLGCPFHSSSELVPVVSCRAANRFLSPAVCPCGLPGPLLLRMMAGSQTRPPWAGEGQAGQHGPPPDALQEGRGRASVSITCRCCARRAMPHGP